MTVAQRPLSLWYDSGTAPTVSVLKFPAMCKIYVSEKQVLHSFLKPRRHFHFQCLGVIRRLALSSPPSEQCAAHKGRPAWYTTDTGRLNPSPFHTSFSIMLHISFEDNGTSSIADCILLMAPRFTAHYCFIAHSLTVSPQCEGIQ